MKASDAVKLMEESQEEFVNENIEFIIKEIDKNIVTSAKGSRQYPVKSCQINLDDGFEIIKGSLIEPLKKHYNKNGFEFSYHSSSQSGEWITISWINI